MRPRRPEGKDTSQVYSSLNSAECMVYKCWSSKDCTWNKLRCFMGVWREVHFYSNFELTQPNYVQ